ncbi:hypothetical protein [Atlantibacter subterraneus]|uniref:hypothetical protein n=1 Tax=Atlantibacter subterraneus TaxID=255519 RepID=UPI0028A67E7D|nr:hypothetical protein [Atlantibacter subterranea]
MMSWIYAAAICAAVVAYWIVCRKNALKHQEKAVQLIEAYFADDSVSDSEKSKMYVNYVLLKKWFALPLLFVVAPFFITIAFISKKYSFEDFGKTNSPEFEEVFKSLMEMNIVRNPLISALFMSMFGVLYAIVMVIGVVMNKASKIPSYTMLASTLVAKLVRLRYKFRHAH